MSMEILAGSSRGTHQIAGKKQRSKVADETGILPGVDGRTIYARRCRDVLAEHLSDIPDASAAERSIIRRASVLTVELERLEAKFATAGEASPDEIDLYARVAGNLRRLLEAVGLQRRSRDTGITLGDLLKEDLRQQREAAARTQEPQP